MKVFEFNKDSDLQLRAMEALMEVIDPEMMVNIVDLGLIYQVDFLEDGRLYLVMTLTSQFCPMGDAIQTGARNALEHAFPDRTVEIELRFDPPWSYDLISPEGLEQLRNR